VLCGRWMRNSVVYWSSDRVMFNCISWCLMVGEWGTVWCTGRMTELMFSCISWCFMVGEWGTVWCTGWVTELMFCFISWCFMVGEWGTVWCTGWVTELMFCFISWCFICPFYRLTLCAEKCTTGKVRASTSHWLLLESLWWLLWLLVLLYSGGGIPVHLRIRYQYV